MLKNQNVTANRLITKAIEVLREYGLNAEIERTNPKIGKGEVDALLRVQKGTQETLFLVEAKHTIDQATLNQAIQKRAHERGTLLVADFVPPLLAERLRENRIAFVDLAGNAWLHTPEYLIWVNGRKAEAPRLAARPPRAFLGGGLQLIFGLLMNPKWVALPTRELATKIGIANGTVAAALRDLEEQGFVIRVGKRMGGRRLRNRETLLNKWTEGYLQRFQPTTLINRYQTGANEADWWKHLQGETNHALLGNEAAAAILTGFLTPGVITIYVPGNGARLIVEHKLRPDPTGPVELRRRFWKFAMEEWEDKNVVPPLLIYADLMGTNEARCIETAGRIKDKYLARLLED